MAILHRLPRVLLATLLAAACDGADGPVPVGQPAHLGVVAGSNQTAVAGGALDSSLVVRVTDSRGTSVPGQEVRFSVAAGGGSVSAASVRTGADGRARVAWTLGTTARDTQKVEARVETAGGGALAAVLFRAVAVPDTPAILKRAWGDDQIGVTGRPLPSLLAVKLTDRFGNGIAGRDVRFAVTAGGGRASPELASTDSAGIAQVEWTQGTRVDTLPQLTATFGTLPPVAFQAICHLAGTFSILSGDGQSAEVGHFLPDSLAVRAATEDGAPVQGVLVQWRTTSGSVVPDITYTGSDGRARAVWLLGSVAGRWTATATAEFHSSVVFNGAATPAPVRVGPPVALVVTRGDAQQAPFRTPVADSLAVQARDSAGSPVPGATVTWTVMKGGGSVSPATYVTDAFGVARTRLTIGPGPDGENVVRASLAGGPSVSVTAWANNRDVVLTKVSGDEQTGVGGSVLSDSLVLRVTNVYGTPIPGVWVGFAPWNDEKVFGGSALPDHGVSDADGLVKTSWRLPTNVARATLRYNHSGGIGYDEAFRANVVGSAPAVVVLYGNTSFQGAPGARIPVSVRVLDALSNPMPRVLVSWSATAGGGSFAPAADSTDANGVATSTWTLGAAAGRNAGLATVGTLPPAELYANASSGTALAVRIDQPTTIRPVGDVLPLEATITSKLAAVSVTARVLGRSKALAGSGQSWVGSMDLSGLPRGALSVRVTAVSAQGDTAVAERAFVHDTPPKVTISPLVAYNVARPTLRVVATCTDDDPVGCTTMSVATPYRGVGPTNYGRYDDVVDLSGLDGTRITLTVRASDTAGNTGSATVDVEVETNPHLVPIARAPGKIAGVDGSRIMYVDRSGPTPVLKVVTVGGGGEQTVYTASSAGEKFSARLTRNGVVLRNASGLFEVRGGVATLLTATPWVPAFPSPPSPDYMDVAVRGQYLLYHEASGRLVRRDVVSGTEATVGSSTRPGNDVTETGTVIFTSGGILNRWSGGAAVPIPGTNGGDGPSASDDLVAFARVVDGRPDFYLSAPGGVELLSVENTGKTSFRGPGYFVAGKWAAFTRQRYGDIERDIYGSELWVRSPTGSRTALPDNAIISALADDGTLVAYNLPQWDAFGSPDAQRGGFYVARPPYGTRTRVATIADGWVWVDGQLEMVLGTDLFRVVY